MYSMMYTSSSFKTTLTLPLPTSSVGLLHLHQHQSPIHLLRFPPRFVPNLRQQWQNPVAVHEGKRLVTSRRVKQRIITIEHPVNEQEEEEEIYITKLDPEIKRGSIAGAVSLIIGTSIGSGILAIPDNTSPAGFIPSATSIIICWTFLVIEALILAEINVNLRKNKRHKDTIISDQIDGNINMEIISIRTMAQETLGEWGGNVATATYLFLSYTSMIAYTSKSGEVVSRLVQLPDSVSGATFTMLIALLISLGGTRITDQVNQCLTFVMIGLLALIEATSISVGDGLSVPQMTNWDKVPQMMPVIIFTLVFHDIAPVICAYLGGDLVRIRFSIVFGSLVPLLFLLLWDDIALGLPSNVAGFDPLDLLKTDGFSGMGLMIEAFSLLAVGTSLIGTLLGASQFFVEQIINVFPLKQPSHGIENEDDLSENKGWSDLPGWRHLIDKSKINISATLAVIIPTILLSAAVPDAFSLATDFAGGYCMMILYGALPPMMAWAMHFRLTDQENQTTKHQSVKNRVKMVQLSGTKPVLLGMGLLSIMVVIEQFMTDMFTLNSYLFSSS